MPNEARQRRIEFRGGLPIVLADGQEWAFPGPREVFPSGRPLDLRTIELLNALDEAEDLAERQLGELALAIHLLGLNYQLGADDYQRLLCLKPGDPDLVRLRAAISDLACRHAASWSERRSGQPSAVRAGRRFRLPAFRPHPAQPAPRTKAAS